MSTNITISTSGNSLIDRTKAQQQAARATRLTREQIARQTAENRRRILADARTTPTQRAALTGTSPARFIIPPPTPLPFRRPEPAATRTGGLAFYFVPKANFTSLGTFLLGLDGAPLTGFTTAAVRGYRNQNWCGSAYAVLGNQEVAELLLFDPDSKAYYSPTYEYTSEPAGEPASYSTTTSSRITLQHIIASGSNFFWTTDSNTNNIVYYPSLLPLESANRRLNGFTLEFKIRLGDKPKLVGNYPNKTGYSGAGISVVFISGSGFDTLVGALDLRFFNDQGTEDRGEGYNPGNLPTLNDRLGIYGHYTTPDFFGLMSPNFFGLTSNLSTNSVVTGVYPQNVGGVTIDCAIVINKTSAFTYVQGTKVSTAPPETVQALQNIFQATSYAITMNVEDFSAIYYTGNELSPESQVSGGASRFYGIRMSNKALYTAPTYIPPTTLEGFA